MDSASAFNREDVFGGMPARRARTLLFLIESRSARLTWEAKQAMTLVRSEQATADGELAFISAFSEGQAPPLKPSIQDLERWAGQWSALVPAEPRTRAALAHVLGAKYSFTRRAVPGITAALGLDESVVQEAFLRQYGAPIASIYHTRLAGLERLRWVWTTLARRLESLPAFWTSFALTVTETVGAGTLALPIALAGIGPLPGILLMIVFGLVNVGTIIAESEAAARSGTVRYGSGFMGRMVRDYLGDFASLVLTVAVAVLCALALLAFYIGFAAAMAGFTGLPQPVWLIGLFLVGLYLLRRESLNATVGAALVVGAVNLGIILVLSLLAFARIDPANLLYVNVPFVNGRPFDPSLLALIFGVILAAFFGHLSVNNCARVVLRRDASARSLIGGAAAAQIAAIAIYSIWVLAVAGAVPPETLQAEKGTALGPVAAVIGPVAVVLSSVYVVLALAMSSLHMSLGLFNLVRERLPTQASVSIRLPLREGRLILSPRPAIRDLFRAGRQSDRLALTYLGLEDGWAQARPRVRLDLSLGGRIHVLEITLEGAVWDESALAGLLPDLDPREIRLRLEVVEAGLAGIEMRVASPMVMRYEGQRESAGTDLAALQELADEERGVWLWLSQQPQPADLAEIAAGIEADEQAAQGWVESLVERRLVSESLADGQLRYQVRFAARRRRSIPEALLSEEARPPAKARHRPGNPGKPSQQAFWARLDARSRYWICTLPVVATFMLTEYLLITGRASFSGAFSLIGTLVVPLLGGFFPVLLLVAGRRKGDVVPGVAPRLVGQPLVVVLIYLLYLAGLLLYGLVIWQEPWQRLAALAVAILGAALPVVLARRGAFRRRAVIEVRAGGDRKQQGAFAVSAAGKPQPVAVQLHYDRLDERCQAASGEISNFAALRTASFAWLPGAAEMSAGIRDVKVWTHALSDDGADQPLPASAELRCGEALTTCDLGSLDGQVVLPLSGADFAVRIGLQGSSQEAL